MKSSPFFVIAVLWGALQVSCTSMSSKYVCLKDKAGVYPCRPFRAGLMKLNPELDEAKPLAAIDEAGWVTFERQLIGSPHPRWLMSIAVDTEKAKWKHELSSSPVSPIAIFNGFVIVGLRDGTLKKIDAKTGKQIWQQNVGKFVARRPILHNGKLFAVSVQQKVFCIDFATGKTQWIYDAVQPSGLIISGGSEPIILGNTLIVGTNEGVLHGVDVKQGKRAWLFDPGSKEFRFRDVIGQLAIVDGAVLVSRYDGLVYLLNVKGKRRILWQKKLMNLTASHTRKGITYLSGLNGEFLSLDAKSGRIIWKTEVGQPVRSITSGDKVVYLGGTEGRITALDTKLGKILWHDDIGGSTTNAPVLFGDILYFATGLKVLYGYKVL